MSYTIKHGVIEMAIQSSNILQHVMPLGNFNFIQYCTLVLHLKQTRLKKNKIWMHLDLLSIPQSGGKRLL